MKVSLSAEERSLLRGRQVRLEELDSLRGWYPVVAEDDGLWWRFFGGKRFSEPFFHYTVSSLAPAERICLQTPWDAAKGIEETLAPAAFIFHSSRCGSTLLTQLLACLPDCVVFSEPSVIDSFLRRYHAEPSLVGAEQKLRSIVGALGQRRFPEERHLFIKLDSWHIGSLPLFRRAFPATPFLFLYRHPDEIMASHRRQRGRQMVPGLVEAAIPRTAFTPPPPHDLEGYCLTMLEYIFSSARTHADQLIFIDYQQLPSIIWEDLLDFFSVTAAPEQLAAMKSRAGLHSKTGGGYSGDPNTEAAYGRAQTPTLYLHYEQLEQLRLKQRPFCSDKV